MWITGFRGGYRVTHARWSEDGRRGQVLPMTDLDGLTFTTNRDADTLTVIVAGLLHPEVYRALRDHLVEAALAEPRAVLVDIADLAVEDPESWSVFGSARWYVNTWPKVPILLFGNEAASRWSDHEGARRFAPVYLSRDDALAALADDATLLRRQMRIALAPGSGDALTKVRNLVRDSLRGWSHERFAATAGCIATVLVENALNHADSAVMFMIETQDNTVAVAVSDADRRPAVRRESSIRGTDAISGLSIVAALSRGWGSAPTPTGKTVWALIGAENCI